MHSEAFSVLLVPFFWRSLDTQTRKGFEEMNQALKLRAEHYNSAAQHCAEPEHCLSRLSPSG